MLTCNGRRLPGVNLFFLLGQPGNLCDLLRFGGGLRSALPLVLVGAQCGERRARHNVRFVRGADVEQFVRAWDRHVVALRVHVREAVTAENAVAAESHFSEVWARPREVSGPALACHVSSKIVAELARLHVVTRNTCRVARAEASALGLEVVALVGLVHAALPLAVVVVARTRLASRSRRLGRAARRAPASEPAAVAPGRTAGVGGRARLQP
mmetsp:Transcript_5498/g.13128  ORF Transcript_5498/g.13128 Transcript_5498/m.13128 type:complete len:212 (+) Transcript_5498:1499-2134(+)